MEIKNQQPQTIIRFSWEIFDDGYTYMDIWKMTQEEWNALSHEDIAIRQQEQYQQWRNYMNNSGA